MAIKITTDRTIQPHWGYMKRNITSSLENWNQFFNHIFPPSVLNQMRNIWGNSKSKILPKLWIRKCWSFKYGYFSPLKFGSKMDYFDFLPLLFLWPRKFKLSSYFAGEKISCLPFLSFWFASQFETENRWFASCPLIPFSLEIWSAFPSCFFVGCFPLIWSLDYSIFSAMFLGRLPPAVRNRWKPDWDSRRKLPPPVYFIPVHYVPTESCTFLPRLTKP